jgi:hypothetical protein
MSALNDVRAHLYIQRPHDIVWWVLGRLTIARVGTGM